MRIISNHLLQVGLYQEFNMGEIIFDKDKAGIFLTDFVRRMLIFSRIKYLESNIKIQEERKPIISAVKLVHPTINVKPFGFGAPSGFVNINRETKREVHGFNQHNMYLPVSYENYSPPLSESQVAELGLSKIKFFAFDPSVISVECQGAGRNLIVNKSGKIQTSSFSLNKEEIEEIVKKISEKTRIPVISGVFRAAFSNFVFIAVISEFVGTRFVIERKTPIFM